MNKETKGKRTFCILCEQRTHYQVKVEADSLEEAVKLFDATFDPTRPEETMETFETELTNWEVSEAAA